MLTDLTDSRNPMAHNSQPTTSLFVGLDFGGSGTRAALATAEGELLAFGRGGPSGHTGSGPAQRRLLGRALDAALAPIAPLIADRPAVISAGTTGLSLPGRRDAIALELNVRFPPATIRVTNDALIALWGGLAGRQGVAVLAGTGSIALARAADGREARAGGWGYLLGDEGGAFWLGRAALASLLRVLEGRQAHGLLTRSLLTALRLDPATAAVPDVVAWTNVGPRPARPGPTGTTAASSGDTVARIGGLAPLVSRAADDGDPLAVDLLCQAGHALAEMASAATRQLWPATLPDSLAVVCRGGLWAAGDALVQPFTTALAERGLPTHLTAALLPPVGGALLLALGAPTRVPAPAVLDRLAAGFSGPAGL
jgi:N-acetylglucosamine kinase-like BadF-type ATPase